MNLPDILQRLQELHQARQPLNLSAARRHSPDLVAAVYAIRPFFGWKKALAAAGIDYAEISIDIQEYLVCNYCDVEVKHLANHVIIKHETTWEEYLQNYPGAEAMCESTRALQFKNTNDLLPHWELLWTVEYAMDRLRAWHDSGFPVNESYIMKHDGALYNFFRKNNHCGHISYDELLKAIDLDPNDIRKRVLNIYLSPKDVLDGIKLRYKNGLPLNTSAVNGDAHTLYASSVKFFGTWAKALKKAGYSQKKHIRRYRYCKPEQVTDCILRRHAKALPLNHGYIHENNSALASAALRLFGSWDHALQAAQLNPLDIRKSLPVKSLDSAKIIEWGQTYARTHGHVRRTIIIKQGYSYESNAAFSLFGSWENFLNQPEIAKALNDHRVSLFPDKPALIVAIQSRSFLGLPLNPKDVRHDKTNGGLQLFARAVELCGSWPVALEIAGIDIRGTEGRQRYRLVSPSEVIAEVKRRAEEGLSLRSSKVFRQDETLMDRACEFFGSWNEAMKASGLPGVAPTDRYPDGQSISNELKRRFMQGISPTITAVWNKKETRDLALFRRAVELFGSWTAALTASEIPHRIDVRPSAYPDKASVSRALTERRDLGMSMSARVLSSPHHTQRNLALYASASKHYGFWKNAIESINQPEVGKA